MKISGPVASYELDRIEPDPSGIVVVALSGELDVTNADDFLGSLRGLTNRDVPVVLDLSRLVFIDSTAIHHLFRIAEGRDRNSLAFVVEPAATVAATLEIVGLDRAAPVLPSLDAAKALLSDANSP